MSCHQNSSNVNRLQLKLVVCSSQYNSNKKEEENKQQIYVSADMCVSPCLWQALSLSHTHTSLCKTRMYRWCNLSEPDVVVNFIADSYEGIQYPWKRPGRHQAHLDCAADIAAALLTVFLDYIH